MPHLFVITFLLFFSLNWKEFKSKEGRFKVSVPEGKLTEKRDTMPTKVGDLIFYTFFYRPIEENPDNELYTVSYVDYPDYTLHSDSTDMIKEFYDATIETAVKSVSGVLQYQTDIKQDNFNGKLWRITYRKGNAVIKTKAVVVQNRYYSVQVVSRRAKGLNHATDKFLESFHVWE